MTPGSASACSGVPAAMTRPALRTTMWPHSERMACMTCSTIRIVRPSSRLSWAMRSMPASSSVGLRPASHSSSSRSWARRRARAPARCASSRSRAARRRRRTERASKAHARQQPLGLGAGGGDVEPAASIHGGDSDVVARVERVGNARELEGAADAGAAHGLGRAPGDGLAAQAHLARVGCEPARDDVVEESGLARAVGARSGRRSRRAPP